MSRITLPKSTVKIIEHLIIQSVDLSLFHALTAVFNIWYITRHYYG